MNLKGSAVLGSALDALEKVGSGAEAENVKLMKSSEEDGRFYRVKVQQGQTSLFSAPVFTQLGGTRYKEDRAA